mgnify:CR=1 FL=1
MNIPWCALCGEPMEKFEHRPELIRYRCSRCSFELKVVVAPPVQLELAAPADPSKPAPRAKRSYGGIPIRKFLEDDPEAAPPEAAGALPAETDADSVFD